MSLEEVLIRRGVVTPEQLADVAATADGEMGTRTLGELLVERGLLTELGLLEALGEQFGVEVRHAVDEGELDPTLVDDLSVDWARTHGILPIRTESGIGMLTSDPTLMDVQDDLALTLNAEVTPILCPRAAVLEAIERCYFQREDTAKDFLRQISAPQDVSALGEHADEDLLRVSGDAPVTQLVNLILLEALKAGASDIHIEPLQQRLRIRYRIDGQLYDQSEPPKHLQGALVSRLKVMGRVDIAEKRLPQDGMARVRVGEREVDVRLSTVPVPEGERVVLRLLDRDSALLPLTALGMPASLLKQFRALLRAPHGVILITGPTGSGKTTTLYAALQELDTERVNVMTVEDPIEYQLPHIGQIQVKPKIGLTFAHGLRHILRQDPDVILVGETRDLETAEIVIRASLTGHLVFTTLHTNDASAAVMRLADMGVEPYLLSSSMRAAVAQRLVRKLCVECKHETTLSEDEKRLLGPHAAGLANGSLYTAEGCPACLGGYRGRTGLYELLEVTDDVETAIRAGASAREIASLARKHGAQTLLEAGLNAAKDGVTSVGEIIRSLGPGIRDAERA